jgi:gliding motility-associated-like protein
VDYCNQTVETEVPIALGDPVPFTATVIDVDCDVSAGSISLETFPPTIAEFSWTDAFGVNRGTANELNNLAPGDYFVTVTSPSACPTAVAFEVASLIDIAGELSQESVSCNGLADGKARILPAGASPPFLISWRDQTGNLISTESEVTGLSAGSYEVTVEDAEGCRLVRTVVIEEPEPLSATAAVSYANCDVADSGIIQLVVTGGTPPYRYTLAGGASQSEARFEGLINGDYAVVVSDANSCELELPTIAVTPPPIFRINLGEDERINLGSVAVAGLNISPPDLPLASIRWSPEERLSCGDCLSPEVLATETTLYSVTVVAENGCVATDEWLVEVVATANIYIPNAFSPNGDGINDRVRIFTDFSVESILDFKIFDRWGGLVYSYRNDDIGWDGKVNGEAKAPGMYTYVGQARLLNGRVIQLNGEVLLLR